MTESQRNSIKLLIVGTCINDANYESTFQNITNGIRSFMTLVNTNFPNAKVYCVSCGNRLGQTQNDYNKRRHFKRIVIPALIGANTNFPKFTYVDNSDLWLINSDMFNEDGLHPNESGQNNIAGYLVKAMNNQKSIEYFNAKLYLTYTSTIDGTNDLENTIDVHIHDNFIYFGLPDTNIPITALQGRGFRQIGTWSSNMLHTSEQNGLDFDIPVALFKTGEIIDTTATIRFNYDGKLYLRLNHTDVSNVNTFTLKQTVVNKCMKFI